MKLIKITHSPAISSQEINQLRLSIKNNNFVIYDIGTRVDKANSKNFIKKLASVLGLSRIDSNIGANVDGITSLTNLDNSDSNYIPYSNRRLNWHTDGYYNPPTKTIRSFILHCVTPADLGGDNKIINHNLIYQHLQQHRPEFIEILSQDKVMTIPANIIDGQIIRPEQSGAVFSFDDNNKLHMRYSARQHNIIWQQSAQQAKQYLEYLCNLPEFITVIKLNSGQGLIANNVLHARESFADKSGLERLLLRTRYYDSIK